LQGFSLKNFAPIFEQIVGIPRGMVKPADWKESVLYFMYNGWFPLCIISRRYGVTAVLVMLLLEANQELIGGI